MPQRGRRGAEGTDLVAAVLLQAVEELVGVGEPERQQLKVFQVTLKWKCVTFSSCFHFRPGDTVLNVFLRDYFSLAAVAACKNKKITS